PSAPGNVPKYMSNERFSLIRNTMCWMRERKAASCVALDGRGARMTGMCCWAAPVAGAITPPQRHSMPPRAAATRRQEVELGMERLQNPRHAPDRVNLFFD